MAARFPPCRAAKRRYWAHQECSLARLGSVGSFDEGGPQPGTASARPPAASLARALVIAWTHPRPARQVCGAREAGHVDPDFGDQDLGDSATNPWDRVQPFQSLFKRAQAFLD